MDSELIRMLHNIKDKTGIDIDVFSESMKFLASTKGQVEATVPSRIDFSEVFCDEALDRTYFKFRYKSLNLIGAIKGSGEIEKNYAYFILTFLENIANKGNSIGKNEFIKSMLMGDCSRHQMHKFMRMYSISNEPCFVLIINVSSGKASELFSFLESYASSSNDFATMTDDMNCAYVRYITENSLEWQSASEFAHILYQTLYEETGLSAKIGVGCRVSNFQDVAISYLQAMGAFKMASSLSGKSGVYSYKEYIWVKMIEELPKFKLMEYLELLLDKEAKQIFSDEDMLATAEEFLDNNLNVSETSRKLFMHRNTLMYRLDKIERVTGLNIKKFSDAVTFRLITVLNKLMNLR